MSFRKILLPLIACLSFNAQAQDAEQIKAQIRDKCVSKWSDDYSMVLYCEEKQLTAAVDWLKKVNKASTKSILDPVVKSCDTKWDDDYAMKVHCFDKQIKALNKLGGIMDQNNDTVNGILVKCMQKWDSDYSMVVYCADKQITAYRALQK